MALTIDPRPFVSVRHDQFEVEAKGLGAYLIDVSIPANLARDSRLPVILVLDGNLIFDLVQAIAHGRFTEAAGPLPPAIIVGVGYPAREGFSTYYARRNFDFHGPWEMTDPLGLQLKGLFTSLRNAEGSSGHATEILAGGYSAFLSFLRDDLLPDLAAHYPIDLDGNHTLIGDSSGGHFALRALFDPKSPFSKYIAISPSLGTAPGEIEAAEAAFAATHSDLEADVFVCAGSAEVDESVPIALCRFGSAPIWAAEQFAIRNWPSARLTWEIMNNENHTSIAPRAIATGLRAVHNLRPGINNAQLAAATAAAQRSLLGIK
ncbi:MAG: alpha/beta hydrolase [Sphingomonadales bacterium]|nr:alpha/beta hydrolase [Sphingomonadales bacterium]MBK6491123.1 alpha/beta hydrolase [Sphingomonadales bacterium]MBK6718321.1 alpha/beta hydrolase [Sphingomonadales bacterium]